ncbi:ubiquitin domain-containing protein UBFD1 isoform X1, partial [Clarias magur]
LPPAMQKVMYKGLLPEDKTLREIKVTNGAKIMVVGSTINDVLAVNTPKEVIQQEVKAEENKKEPLCRQKQHRKVLDKGKPEDIMPSIKGAKERLPTVPLSGMFNKSGGKVRLTFKLEQDQLWIGTKERTEKIPMGSIKNVVTEPIEGHEDYHMMAFQLGPTEASQYWVYWVPAHNTTAGGKMMSESVSSAPGEKPRRPPVKVLSSQLREASASSAGSGKPELSIRRLGGGGGALPVSVVWMQGTVLEADTEQNSVLLLDETGNFHITGVNNIPRGKPCLSP